MAAIPKLCKLGKGRAISFLIEHEFQHPGWPIAWYLLQNALTSDQCTAVVLLAEQSPSRMDRLLKTFRSDAKARITLLNSSGVVEASSCTTITLPTGSPLSELEEKLSSLGGQGSRHVALLVDSMSLLCFRYGATAAAAWLERLLRSGRFWLTIALAQAAVVRLQEALRYVVDGVLRTGPPRSASADFTVDVLFKRASGRLLRALDECRLGPAPDALSFAPLPRAHKQETEKKTRVASAESKKQKSKKALQDPTADLPFNLKLTHKQLQARAAVALPYVHHGLGPAPSAPLPQPRPIGYAEAELQHQQQQEEEQEDEGEEEMAEGVDSEDEELEV